MLRSYALAIATAAALVVVGSVATQASTLPPWTHAGSVPSGYTTGQLTGFDGVLYFKEIQGSSPEVYYSVLNGDGTLGPWVRTATPPLSGIYTGNGFVASERAVHITGGSPNHRGVTNVVWFAPRNGDGSLGAWQTTSRMNQSRYQHSTLVVGDFVYVAGGNAWNWRDLRHVEFAPILTDGSLGPWTATAQMAHIRRGGALTSWEGRVYALGGVYNGSGSTYTATTEHAEILANGDLGTWSYDRPMLTNRAIHGAAIVDGMAYYLGGRISQGGHSYENIVVGSPVAGDGSFGAWAEDTRLPAATSFEHYQPVVLGGRIYAISANAVYMSGTAVNPDRDGDGVNDDVDACPDEDASGVDADGDGCIDTAADLVHVVQSMSIHQGIGNALAEKADRAAVLAMVGARRAARHVLLAFIHQVEALVGLWITERDADLLIQFALNAIDSL